MKNVKMNKTVFGHLMMVAFVGSLLLTGCQKEKIFNLRLTLENLAGDSKTYVDGLTMGWVAGDEVRINGTIYTMVNDESVSGDPVNGDLLAFYPASICTTAVLPNTSQVEVTIESSYNYETVTVGNSTKQKLDMPMVGVAAEHATAMKMWHLCSAVDVAVNNTLNIDLTLDYIRLTGTDISGTKTFTVSADNAPVLSSGSGSNTVQMNFSGTTITAHHSLTVQIPVLPTTTDVTVEVCGHHKIDGTTAKTVYTYNRTVNNESMERAKVHGANVSITGIHGTDYMTVATIGAFTVGSNQRVYFSKGNLQYNSGEDSPWRFAVNQWDYCQTSYGTWNTSGWVDLFAYGTWTGSASNPMNTSSDYTFAPTDFDQTLHGSDAWRTLTEDEWNHLLNTRSNTTNLGTANARFAKATVNGIVGVIIFPDSYTHPSGVTTPTNINTSNAAFTGNNYTADAWALMEDAGCVFLPAAGTRSGTTVGNFMNQRGYYWSSSKYNGNPRYLYFVGGSTIYITTATSNNMGCPVRLVR